MSGWPILDLEQAPPKPKSRWLFTWPFTLICLVVGNAIGIMLDATKLTHYPTSDAPPSLNFLFIFPALYIAVAIHELGICWRA